MAWQYDCEHEVQEVKSGHRITLTYNLYVRERLGVIMRDHASSSLSSYVLYHRVKEALASPDYLEKGSFCNIVATSELKTDIMTGGTLGFYFQHVYAHANDHRVGSLPYALKGVDAIFYSVFLDFGLHVSMCAAMNDLSGRMGITPEAS